MARRYDVAVLGASGFTGRLVAARLAAAMTGRLRRLALAGRDRGRVTAVRDELAARYPGAGDIGVVTADTTDAGSLAALASVTRVLATAVGPFLRHGPPVVAACVEAGTDYVDITGEPSYLIDTIHRWHDHARRRGVRIVCCCGFDAVPTDYATWLTVRQLPEDRPIAAEALVTFGGRLSGGTWRTILINLDPAHAPTRRVPPPDDGRAVRTVRPPIRRTADAPGWAVPLPTIDPYVVARSAALLPEFGPSFAFSHCLRLGTTAGLGAALTAGAGLRLAARSATLRRVLGGLLPGGAGPDAQQRARSSFRVRVRGTCDLDGARCTATTEVSGGDPGYGETAVMMAQSALCLVDDRSRLPRRAGVLTPVTAFGDTLITRLRAEGLRFSVGR